MRSLNDLARAGLASLRLPLACSLLVLAPGGASAQSATTVDVATHGPSFLRADHWAVEAARRLWALGLAPAGMDGARRTYSEHHVAALLAHADSVAARGEPSVRAMVEGYVRRFEEEFGRAEGDGPLSASTARGSALEAGYLSHTGRLATGWGYIGGHPLGADYRPPEPLPDVSGATGTAALRLTPDPHVAVQVAYRAGARDSLTHAYVAGRIGPVVMWGGRRSVGYGPGRAGAVVLFDATVDGVGVQSARPVRLPWIFGALGAIEYEVLLGQDDLPRSFDDVFFLATRASLTPHSRVTLGVTRAALFGGEGNTPIDLFAIFSMLVGKHAGDVTELDNQVVAVDAVWRPATERWLPLLLYLEWGFEDSAGAWQDVPGIVAGIRAPSLPLLPRTGAAVEVAHFAQSCCGNPMWYRHAHFVDGWTQDARPIGHPMGGQGTQWTLLLDSEPLAGLLRLDGRLFLRERGPESLYDPDRTGESVGAELEAEWAGEPFRPYVSGRTESGDGWREAVFAVGLRAIF